MSETDDGLCRMTDHPNTYDYALTILKKKGFKLLLFPGKNEGSYGTYWAKKDGRNFDAQDPLRLLGMVSIWEEYGDDWYDHPKMKIENVGSLLADRAYPSSIEDFEKLSETDFRNFVKDYQEFFELRYLFPEIKIKEDISRKEFYEIVTTYYKIVDED